MGFSFVRQAMVSRGLSVAPTEKLHLTLPAGGDRCSTVAG